MTGRAETAALMIQVCHLSRLMAPSVAHEPMTADSSTAMKVLKAVPSGVLASHVCSVFSLMKEALAEWARASSWWCYGLISR